MASRPVPPVRSARTIHSFLIASTLIISIGSFIATWSTGALERGAAAVDYLVTGLGVGMVIFLGSLRHRLPTRSAGQSVDDWWRLHMGQAVLLWGLLELIALLGAAALLLSGHAIGFGLLAVLALGGLLTLSPRRLAGE